MIVGGLEPSTDNEVLPWGDAGWLYGPLRAFIELRLQIVYERRARYKEVPSICSGEIRFVKHGMSNALFVARIAVQL